MRAHSSIGVIALTIIFISLASCPKPPRGIKGHDISPRDEIAVFPAGQLRAGAASLSITPEGNQFLAGFGNNRVSRGVHDDIFVKAVVLEQGGERMALVGYDLIGLQRHQLGPFLEAMAEHVPAERIVIACTHTHSAPDVMGFWGESLLSDGRDMEYFAWIAERGGEAVGQAVKALRPVELRFGSVTVDPPGIVRNIREPEILDPELGAIGIYNLGERMKPYAVLINFAMHPETLWDDNLQITSDWPGYMRDMVKRETGCEHALFFNGALGAMVTVDNRLDDEGEDITTFEEAERVGNEVARYALAALKGGEWANDPKVVFGRRVYYSPYQNPIMDFGAHIGVLTRPLYEYRIETEVVSVRIGDLMMVTFPGEVYPKIGTAIREEMDAAYCWRIGPANDMLAYMLYKRDHRRRLYRYENTVSFTGPGGGEALEKNAALLIDAVEALSH